MNASMAVNGALKNSAILVQLATFTITPLKVVFSAQITVMLALMLTSVNNVVKAIILVVRNHVSLVVVIVLFVQERIVVLSVNKDILIWLMKDVYASIIVIFVMEVLVKVVVIYTFSMREVLARSAPLTVSTAIRVFAINAWMATSPTPSPYNVTHASHSAADAKVKKVVINAKMATILKKTDSNVNSVCRTASPAWKAIAVSCVWMAMSGMTQSVFLNVRMVNITPSVLIHAYLARSLIVWDVYQIFVLNVHHHIT